MNRKRGRYPVSSEQKLIKLTKNKKPKTQLEALQWVKRFATCEQLRDLYGRSQSKNKRADLLAYFDHHVPSYEIMLSKYDEYHEKRESVKYAKLCKKEKEQAWNYLQDL